MAPSSGADGKKGNLALTDGLGRLNDTQTHLRRWRKMLSALLKTSRKRERSIKINKKKGIQMNSTERSTQNINTLL